MAPARWFSWTSLLLVVIGGAGGVALRALLLLPVPRDAHALVVPALTLVVNLVGSLLLGVVVGWLDGRRPGLRMLLGTGLLGGFTTYSAFAVQAVQTSTNAPLVGLALMAVSLFGGVVAAAWGLVLGRRAGGRGAAGGVGGVGGAEAPEDAE